MKINSYYVTWICHECGLKHGKREVDVATWHPGLCDVCNRMRAVTEPRDFGGLKDDDELDHCIGLADLLY